MRRIIGVLYNLRSVYNTASCFRTADGAGIDELLLVGTTPMPIDKFEREIPGFSKVALGAEKTIRWRYFATITEAIQSLREEKVFIAVLEQDNDSQSLFSFFPPADRDLALVMGSETEGVGKEWLEAADVILEIPMRGKKESLNVSVAFGVGAYQLKERVMYNIFGKGKKN